jgi:hypothetical protein
VRLVAGVVDQHVVRALLEVGRLEAVLECLDHHRALRLRRLALARDHEGGAHLRLSLPLGVDDEIGAGLERLHRRRGGALLGDGDAALGVDPVGERLALHEPAERRLQALVRRVALVEPDQLDRVVALCVVLELDAREPGRHRLRDREVGRLRRPDDLDGERLGLLTTALEELFLLGVLAAAAAGQRDRQCSRRERQSCPLHPSPPVD